MPHVVVNGRGEGGKTRSSKQSRLHPSCEHTEKEFFQALENCIRSLWPSYEHLRPYKTNDTGMVTNQFLCRHYEKLREKCRASFKQLPFSLLLWQYNPSLPYTLHAMYQEYNLHFTVLTFLQSHCCYKNFATHRNIDRHSQTREMPFLLSLHIKMKDWNKGWFSLYLYINIIATKVIKTFCNGIIRLSQISIKKKCERFDTVWGKIQLFKECWYDIKLCLQKSRARASSQKLIPGLQE